MIRLEDYRIDDDGEDEEDGEQSDDDTDDCPHCGRSVYDDAERCPHCGLYLSREDTPPRKPWWVVAGVLACLGMVTWWILHP